MTWFLDWRRLNVALINPGSTKRSKIFWGSIFLAASFWTPFFSVFIVKSNTELKSWDVQIWYDFFFSPMKAWSLAAPVSTCKNMEVIWNFSNDWQSGILSPWHSQTQLFVLVSIWDAQLGSWRNQYDPVERPTLGRKKIQYTGCSMSRCLKLHKSNTHLSRLYCSPV